MTIHLSKVNILIDTGSELSYIKTSVTSKFCLEKIGKTKMNIIGFQGNCNGYNEYEIFEIPLSENNITVKCKMISVEKLSSNLLIGKSCTIYSEITTTSKLEILSRRLRKFM